MQDPEARVLEVIAGKNWTASTIKALMDDIMAEVTDRAKLKLDEATSRLELEEERGRMRKEALKVEMRENEMLRAEVAKLKEQNANLIADEALVQSQLDDAKEEIIRLEDRERELEARAEKAEGDNAFDACSAYEAGALDFAQSQPERSEIMAAFNAWSSQVRGTVEHG